MRALSFEEKNHNIESGGEDGSFAFAKINFIMIGRHVHTTRSEFLVSGTKVEYCNVFPQI